MVSRLGNEMIFVCSGESSFLLLLRECFPSIRVLSALEPAVSNFHKSGAVGAGHADRALLDCVLLSFCGVVLKGCSALSAFAKVLNPPLEIYRVGACKMFFDIPCFSVEYIPFHNPAGSVAKTILEGRMVGDWRQDPVAVQSFGAEFAFRRRHGRAERLRAWLRQAVRSAK